MFPSTHAGNNLSASRIRSLSQTFGRLLVRLLPKAELIDRRKLSSQAEARMACFSYIEGFYNPRRLHSALGYRSPISYEEQHSSMPVEP